MYQYKGRIKIYICKKSMKYQTLPMIVILCFPEVKDVVHPILFLLSDQSDMINGSCLPIEGGALIN